MRNFGKILILLQKLSASDLRLVAALLPLAVILTFASDARATCDKPAATFVVETQDSSATVDWVPSSEATFYQVIYKVAYDPMASWQTAIAYTNSHTITGLLPNTTYCFQVRSGCSGAFSDYTSSKYFSTGPRRAPHSFHMLHVTATTAQVLWQADTSAVHHELYYRIQGDTTWAIDTVGQYERFAQLSDLTSNVTYELVLRSLYSGGYSDSSETVTFATGPCEVPDDLAAISTLATQATVSWTASSLAQFYHVRYRSFGNPTWTETTATGTSKTLTGLSPSTIYQVQVRAECDSTFLSSWATVIMFGTGSCAVPDNLVMSDLQYATARASWNSSSNALGYFLHYRDTTGSNWDTISVSVNEWNFTGLTPGATYEIKVQADCGSSVHSAIGTSQLFSLLNCSVSDSVEVDSTAPGFVRVNWVNPDHPDGHLYHVKYRILGTDQWQEQTVDTVSVDLSRLITGVDYQLIVRSLCDSLTSADFSDTLVFSTTLCPPPDLLPVDTAGYVSAQVKWNSVANAENYFLLYAPSSSQEWSMRETSDTLLVLDGLNVGGSYKWMVKSFCGVNGESMYSAVDTFETLACRTPDSLWVSNVGLTSGEITWLAVDSAQSYLVTYRSDLDFSEHQLPTVDTTAALAQLFASTQYNIQVSAQCDSAVYSPVSRVYVLETDECGQPTGFTATADGYRGFTAVWDPVSGVDGYTFRWLHPDSTDWVSAFTEDTFAVVASLEPGESYLLEVRSECDTAIDAWSHYAETFELELPSCSTPAGLTLAEAGDDSLLVVWNEAGSAQAYELQWRERGESSWNTVEVADTSYVLESLSSCTIHEFRVRTLCDTLDDVSSNHSAAYFATTTGAGCWNVPLPMAFEFDTLNEGWPTDAWSLNDQPLPLETRWIDRYGHPRVAVDLSEETPDTCGAFKVYYADVIDSLASGFADTVSIAPHVSGAETVGELRRNCLCKALTDLQDVISDAEEMPEIYVRRSLDLGAGSLASGSSFYDVTSEAAFQGGSVRDLLIAGVDSVSGYDAWLRFDFGERLVDTVAQKLHANWYAPPGSNIDFYSVAQHQAYKLLGFASLFRPNGESLTGAATYSLLDRNWLFYDAADSLYKPVLSSSAALETTADVLTGGALQYAKSDSVLIRPVADVYSEPVFAGGTSLSLVRAKLPYMRMEALQPTLKNGRRNYDLSESELDALCDLGYSVLTIGGGCGNYQPVAATDYVLTRTSQSATFNVLANDIDPEDQPLSLDASFQPQIVSGRGVLNCQSNGTCTFQPVLGFQGVVEIVYLPSDGLRSGVPGQVVIGVGDDNGGPQTPNDVGGSGIRGCVSCDATSLLRGSSFDDVHCTQTTLPFSSDLAHNCPNSTAQLQAGQFTVEQPITNGSQLVYNHIRQGWAYPQQYDVPYPFAPHQRKALICDAPHNGRIIAWKYSSPYGGSLIRLEPGTYCFSAWVANVNPDPAAALPSLMLAVAPGPDAIQPYPVPSQPTANILWHLNGNPRPHRYTINVNIIHNEREALSGPLRYTDGWRRISATFTVSEPEARNYALCVLLDNNTVAGATQNGMDFIIDGIRLDGDDLGRSSRPTVVFDRTSVCNNDDEDYIDVPYHLVLSNDMKDLPAHMLDSEVIVGESTILSYDCEVIPETSLNGVLRIPAAWFNRFSNNPNNAYVRLMAKIRRRDFKNLVPCGWSEYGTQILLRGSRIEVELNDNPPSPGCSESNGVLEGTVIIPTVGVFRFTLLSAMTGLIVSGPITTTDPNFRFESLSNGDYILKIEELVLKFSDGSPRFCDIYLRTGLYVNRDVPSIYNATLECDNGISTGTINVSPIDVGTLPYTYTLYRDNIRFGDSQQTSTGVVYNSLPPGSYRLVVQDANGCMGSVDILTVPPNMFLSSSVQGDEPGCVPEDFTGVVASNITGGDVVISAAIGAFRHRGYVSIVLQKWDEVQEIWVDVDQIGKISQLLERRSDPYLNRFTGLGPGRYRVTATDNSGCTVIGNQVVIDNRFGDDMIITMSQDGCVTPTFGSATLTAAVTNGIDPYQFDWQSTSQTVPPFSDQDVVNAPPYESSVSVAPNTSIGGEYIVTVTDGNGCTAVAKEIVTPVSILNRRPNGDVVWSFERHYDVKFCEGVGMITEWSPWPSRLLDQFNQEYAEGIDFSKIDGFALYRPWNDPADPGDIDWQSPDWTAGSNGKQTHTLLETGDPGIYVFYVRYEGGCIERVETDVNGWGYPQLEVFPPRCTGETTGAVKIQQGASTLNEERFSLDGGMTWYGFTDDTGPSGPKFSYSNNPYPGVLTISNLPPGDDYSFMRKYNWDPPCSSNPVPFTIEDPLELENTLQCASSETIYDVCQGGSIVINYQGKITRIYPDMDDEPQGLEFEEDFFPAFNTAITTYAIRNVIVPEDNSNWPHSHVGEWGVLNFAGQGSLSFSAGDETDPTTVACRPGVYQIIFDATDQSPCSVTCTLNVRVRQRPLVEYYSRMIPKSNFATLNCESEASNLYIQLVPDAQTRIDRTGDPQLRYRLSTLAPDIASVRLESPVGVRFDGISRDDFPYLGEFTASDDRFGCITKFEVSMDDWTENAPMFPVTSQGDPTCEQVNNGFVEFADPNRVPEHLQWSDYWHLFTGIWGGPSFSIDGGETWVSYTDPSLLVLSGRSNGVYRFRNLSATNMSDPNSNVLVRSFYYNPSRLSSFPACLSETLRVNLTNRFTVIGNPLPGNLRFTVSPSGGLPPYTVTANTTPAFNRADVTGTIIVLADPPGNYTVTVTDAQGCSWTGTATSNRMGATSMKPTTSYRLYPNPTRGEVTVEFEEPLTNSAVLRITDLTGRVVQSWNLPVEAASFQFDTKGWAAGLYLVSLFEDNGLHTTVKLIVQD